MALDRTWYNTLVDDDGSNTTGTVWNKAAVDSLMDAIDAVLDGIDDAGALAMAASTELTINTGAVTITAGNNLFSIDTQADAATDDLDMISLDASGRAGRFIILRMDTAGRVPTVKHLTGNVHLTGGDWTPASINEYLMLLRDGSTWYEQYRTASSSGTTTVALSSSGGGSATYTAQSCRWVKNGRHVLVHLTLTINTDSFSAGNLSLTGLPFTSAASDAGGGSSVLIGAALSTSVIAIHAVVDDAATTAALYKVTAAATTQNTRLLASDVQNSSSFEMTLSYIAAA